VPNLAHGLEAKDIKAKIALLISNLVDIQDETGEFLLRLDDGRVIDTKGWNDWEWTHGVGLYGLWKQYEMTADPRAFEIMTQWFADRFEAGTPTKNINTVSPFLTLAYLYEATGDHTYLPYLETWADYVMYEGPRTEEGGFQHIVFNSENPQQLWDDTLMMSVLPLAKIGLLLGRDDFVEEAKRQFMVHVKYLADRKTGMWFHGWTFEGRHNFADALWARGNCWVTIAIPEFIELLDLPPGDALRDFLIDTLEAQIKALARYQDEGHRPVAHPGRRRDLVPRSLGHGGLRLWNPEGGAQALRLQGLPGDGDQGAEGRAGQYRRQGRAAAGVVRHPGVRHPAGLQGHPPDLDALRPVPGHPGPGRVPAGLHLDASTT
jgi:unsaturated rhamnogalacturonyl hydrolase